MIDTLTKAIDYIASLRTYKRSERRALFDNVFKPMFDELLIVHGDYIEMFERVILALPGYDQDHPGSWHNPEYSDSPPGSAAYDKQILAAKEALKANRRKFEPVRAKLKAFEWDDLAVKLPQEEGAFISAVRRYFPTGQWPIVSTSSERIQRELELAYCKSDYDVKCVVDETIKEHKSRWSDVCATYAKMQVAVWRG